MHADINECSNGTHSCEQVCNNTQGSHHCLCYSGYELNEDDFTCIGNILHTKHILMCHCMITIIILMMFFYDIIIDVDECTTGIDKCDQNCQNNVGSYVCSCNLGFMLNNDGFRCDGISSCYALFIHFHPSMIIIINYRYR